MQYYNKQYNSIQSSFAPGLLEFPDEFLPEYYKEGKRAYGFVTITDDGVSVTSCIWDEEAYQRWCEENPAQPTAGETESYIPTSEQSAIAMMKSVFSAQVPSMTADQILQCSGLAPDWATGKHKTGEVYNVDNQTWECLSDYDNSEHQDVVPGNSAWFTFNRPYHGRTPETARQWVKPQNGTTDMYRVGEFMVWTDGYTYRATRDTTFSPEEYAPDWEKR